MPINFPCHCGLTLAVREEYAGMGLRCPGCGKILTIPNSPLPSPTPAPSGPLHRNPSPDPEEAAPRGNLLPLVIAVSLILMLLGGGVAAVLLIGSDNPAPAPAAQTATPSAPPADSNPPPADNPTATPPPEKLPPAVTPPVPVPAPPVTPEGPPPLPAEPATTPVANPFQGHSAAVFSARFTVDGRYALSGSGGIENVGGKPALAADSSIRIWGARSGEELRRLRDFPTGLAAVAFSPDGRKALVAGAALKQDGTWLRGADHDLHLWDLGNSRELRVLQGHTRSIFCIAFSPDGHQALSGGPDGVVRLWDVDTGKLKHRLEGHAQTVTSVAFSPDGRQALTGSMDHTVRLWSLADGLELRQLPGHQDIVWAVTFSPDGKLAASSGGMQRAPDGSGYVAGARDYEIRLWDVAAGIEVRRFKGHQEAVGALAFAPDGRRLLSGSNDNTVRLWQVEDGHEVRRFEGHTGLIRCVAFAPDGRRALSGSDDHSLRVWELPLDIPVLVKNLSAAGARERREAAVELGRYRTEARAAIPALLQAMAGADNELRPLALAALRQIGAPAKEQAALLVPLLRGKDYPAGRLYALETLESLGAGAAPATAALVEMLADRSAEVRRRVIELLGTIGALASATAYLPLFKALHDARPEVSKVAADALAKLGAPPKALVPELGRLLKDSSEVVRRQALAALGRLGAAAVAAAPDLIELARDDRAADVRVAALHALALVRPGAKEARAAFRRALADSDAGVCREAARGLALSVKELDAFAALLGALDHSDAMVAKIADDALETVPLDATHVPALRTALGSKKLSVRVRMIAALGLLGADAAAAVPDLVRVLEKKQGVERTQAIQALGKIGKAAGVAGPQLAALLKEDDRELRLQVSLTLAKLDCPEREEAFPYLVKGLYITSTEDEAQVASRKKMADFLVKIGKPVVPALTTALEKTFVGGTVRSKAGVLNAEARLVTMQVLDQIGPPPRDPNLLRVLTEMARSEPFRPVRDAARVLRIKVLKE